MIKKVFLIILLVVCTQCVLYAQEKPVVYVFLIGGQSNATGQGYIKNLPADARIDTSVLLYHSGRPHLDAGVEPFQWMPLHQASESPDRFGPELGFGFHIRQLIPAQKIAIIKHAHSGTNLYNQWNPGENAGDSLNQGEQFRIFVQTVEKGLYELRASGYKPVIKAMLWQQGEGDAEKSETAVLYAQHLQHFIQRIRQQFDAPGLLFIYGYVLPPPNNYAGREAVRKAQQDIDEKSGSAIAVKRAHIVITDDLEQRAADIATPYPNDHLHFGTAGTWQLGIRMADMVFKYMK